MCSVDSQAVDFTPIPEAVNRWAGLGSGVWFSLGFRGATRGPHPAILGSRAAVVPIAAAHFPEPFAVRRPGGPGELPR